MIKAAKAVVHKFGRSYVDHVVDAEVDAHKFSRYNERPIEFAFVFETMAKYRPHRILDVGTGTTALPHLMANCGAEVTAIDNIADYWKDGMHNRHWRVIDDNILRPKKVKGPFDLITCVSVIEHIVDHMSAFRNMHKMLSPGGKLLITTPYNERIGVPNVYKLPGSAYGKDEPYPCRSSCRQDLNFWADNTGARLIEQRYYQLWTGQVWTLGDFLTLPKQTGREDLHQLSLMLFAQ